MRLSIRDQKGGGDLQLLISEQDFDQLFIHGIKRRNILL
jgi:hypothetical protein